MSQPGNINKTELDSGSLIIAITLLHSSEIVKFPKHHNDLFDRLLVAQCLVESMQRLTHDSQIKKYGDFVLLV